MDKPITPYYSQELVEKLAEELRKAVERTKAGDLEGSAFHLTINNGQLETTDEANIP